MTGANTANGIAIAANLDTLLLVATLDSIGEDTL